MATKSLPHGMGTFYKDCEHPQSRWSKCPHGYMLRYRNAAGKQTEEAGFSTQEKAIARLTAVYQEKKAAPRNRSKADRIRKYGAMQFREYTAEWKAASATSPSPHSTPWSRSSRTTSSPPSKAAGLVVFDAGYGAPRMAYLLTGLPTEVLGRMRSDRVMRRPAPSLKEYALSYPQGGRPPKRGKEFRFAKPDTWGEPDAETVQVTDRYGTAKAMAWDRIHPRLTTRSAWIDHTGELPVIESSLIRLQVDHLPGGQDPLPLWLWSSKTGMASTDVDLRWQAFLRRFDLEHTFRFVKQTLGWTRPGSVHPRPRTGGRGS